MLKKPQVPAQLVTTTQQVRAIPAVSRLRLEQCDTLELLHEFVLAQPDDGRCYATQEFVMARIPGHPTAVLVLRPATLHEPVRVWYRLTMGADTIWLRVNTVADLHVALRAVPYTANALRVLWEQLRRTPTTPVL